MARIDRDGVGIHYEANGTGPAVLLSHVYSATCRMWDGQVAALKDRWRVIVWDMRGHGQSDYPDDQGLYSEAHTVEDMASVLRACGETRAVIGGLSLGVAAQGAPGPGHVLGHETRPDPRPDVLPGPIQVGSELRGVPGLERTEESVVLELEGEHDDPTFI